MVINFYHTSIAIHDVDSAQLWCHRSRPFDGATLVLVIRLQQAVQIEALKPVIIAFVKALVIINADLKNEIHALRTRINSGNLDYTQKQTVKSR